MPRRIDTNRRNGWTLVEVLVVVVVVALLLGLSLFVLAKVRSNTRVASCLNVLRQQATLTMTYGNDAKDYFPYGLEPGPVVKNETRSFSVDMADPYSTRGYRHVQGAAWLAMSRMFGTERSYRAPHCLADNRERLAPAAMRAQYDAMPSPKPPMFGASFDYSFALFVHPDLLKASGLSEQPRWEPSLLVPQRWSRVVYPAQKSLILENLPYHETYFAKEYPALTTQTPYDRIVASADGAGSIRPQQTCTPAVVFAPRASPPELARMQQRADLLHTTPDGIRGVDWK